MNYTIKKEDIENYNNSDSFSFPKYTSQLINLANQNAQGTRPVVVGKMSDLFQEFLESDEERNIDGWRVGIWNAIQVPLKKQRIKSGNKLIIFVMQ